MQLYPRACWKSTKAFTVGEWSRTVRSVRWTFNTAAATTSDMNTMFVGKAHTCSSVSLLCVCPTLSCVCESVTEMSSAVILGCTFRVMIGNVNHTTVFILVLRGQMPMIVN